MRTVRRRPDVIWDVVDDTMTVLNTASVEIFELNESGRVIWEGCDGRSPEAITTALHERYPGVARSELHAHLAKYLGMLVEAELVDVVESEEGF